MLINKLWISDCFLKDFLYCYKSRFHYMHCCWSAGGGVGVVIRIINIVVTRWSWWPPPPIHPPQQLSPTAEHTVTRNTAQGSVSLYALLLKCRWWGGGSHQDHQHGRSVLTLKNPVSTTPLNDPVIPIKPQAPGIRGLIANHSVPTKRKIWTHTDTKIVKKKNGPIGIPNSKTCWHATHRDTRYLSIPTPNPHPPLIPHPSHPHPHPPAPPPTPTPHPQGSQGAVNTRHQCYVSPCTPLSMYWVCKFKVESHVYPILCMLIWIKKKKKKKKKQ